MASGSHVQRCPGVAMRGPRSCARARAPIPGCPVSRAGLASFSLIRRRASWPGPASPGLCLQPGRIPRGTQPMIWSQVYDPLSSNLCKQYQNIFSIIVKILKTTSDIYFIYLHHCALNSQEYMVLCWNFNKSNKKSLSPCVLFIKRSCYQIFMAIQ